MTALILAFALPLPWTILHLAGFHGSPVLTMALTGIAILGAAFILSWAAELFQKDVSQALALTLLALIAILPEYAVDAVFALEAGRDPVVAQQGYAVANMTGANRLLIGIGWSSIVLFAWLRHRARGVALGRSQALELAVLLFVSGYGLTIPLKGELGLLDTAVLVPLFGLYAWLSSKAPSEEPDLAGPAQLFEGLSTGKRRLAVGAMFLIAAYVIFIAAEPFADGLVETGLSLGIDEFLLVQWLAPLASEAPEFTVALLFVARGHAAAGMRTLISSEVNQWTLLVATLPVVFSIGAERLGGMPLIDRQGHEIWLTAAQSLFAVLLIAHFRLSRWGALALCIPFLLQLVLPLQLEGVQVRPLLTAGYFAASVLLLLMSRERRESIGRWRRYILESLQPRPPKEAVVPISDAGESILS